MQEADDRVGAQAGGHIVGPAGGVHLVRQCHNHQISAANRLVERKGGKAVGCCRRGASATGSRANKHAQAAVAQVQRMRAPLVSVPDHRNLRACKGFHRSCGACDGAMHGQV